MAALSIMTALVLLALNLFGLAGMFSMQPNPANPSRAHDVGIHWYGLVFIPSLLLVFCMFWVVGVWPEPRPSEMAGFYAIGGSFMWMITSSMLAAKRLERFME